MERPILRLLLGCPVPAGDLFSAAFHKGETYYLWTVVGRKENEILLEWRSPLKILPFWGTTW